MDGAEAPDEVEGVDADDAAFREQVGEYAEGNTVVRVVECGDEHGRICDQEICVARGQTLAAIDDGFGHREKCDLDP